MWKPSEISKPISSSRIASSPCDSGGLRCLGDFLMLEVSGERCLGSFLELLSYKISPNTSCPVLGASAVLTHIYSCCTIGLRATCRNHVPLVAKNFQAQRKPAQQLWSELCLANLSPTTITQNRLQNFAGMTSCRSYWDTVHVAKGNKSVTLLVEKDS